ncbi:amidohydrolase family protein [Mesorhizobium sp. M0571]|uniref:amidohydrolase family protein n=1 Tax=unclassified Mesorhizobium TaxID=325217 RepID=UPI003338B1A0
MGFGTDLDGDSQEDQGLEFALRTEVLSPAAVIRSATRTNAALLQREHDIGRIAVGYRSDLIIIDGDPLRDIRILGAPKHLRLVMVGERLAKNDLL